MLRLSLLLTTCLLLASNAAAVPQTLSHQGRFLGADNQPVGGVHGVIFALYRAAEGGSALWSEQLDVSFDDGYYSVTLGDTTNFSDSLFEEDILYLGITLEGQNEFESRTKVNAVPYAIMAGSVIGTVDAQGGLSINGTTVINESRQ